MHLFRAFAYEQTIAEQRAEIERLRAALKRISAMFDKNKITHSTTLKPNYGYYDIVKTAESILYEQTVGENEK